MASVRMGRVVDAHWNPAPGEAMANASTFASAAAMRRAKASTTCTVLVAGRFRITPVPEESVRFETRMLLEPLD